MVGSKKVIPEGAWGLGSYTGDNIHKGLINNDITNVLEYLTQTNNYCNNFWGKQPTNNPTYVIAYTGATQN